ncbi:MAG: hypothetical protein GY743_13020 [Planctomycetaceae bacterium]|nr:hypothetical protein [Planctomycetaceae bacterium]
MASPLAWFRKNQKGMLIVFGVLLMAVFGLPSVFFNLTPQGSRDPKMNEVVVEYSGGRFTRGELRDYRIRNAQAIRFIQELQRSAAEGNENFRPRAALLSPIDASGSPEMLDRQVMRRVLLKEKSDELGMVVGDDAVLDYLRAISDNDELTFLQLNQFAFDLFNNNPDFAAIMAQLKKEIAFEQMIGVVQTGLPRSPNVTNAWENFLKLNRRRGATLLEFPVEKYVAEVGETPNLTELREIFGEGEYEFPDPTNENPGFKAQRKLRAAVLTADYETFLTNAEASIKPEDVQKLYDEYVAAKNPIVMEVIPDPSTESDKNGDDPAPEFNLEGDDGAAEMKTDATDQATDEKATDEKATDEKATDEKATDEKATDEKATDEKATDEKATDEKATEGGTEESAEKKEGNDGLPLNGPSLGDFQEDTKQEDAKPAEAKQEEAKPAEAKPAEAKPVEAKQEDAKPADAKPADAKPNSDGNSKPATADVPAKPTQEATGASGNVEVPAGPPTGLSIDDLNTAPKTKVRELDEELSKILRRELARGPANNAMATALTEAAGDIADFGSDLNAYETTKEGPLDEREPMPEQIDLEQVARDYKLQLQETELVDYADLRKQPLGELGITIQRVFYGRPFQDRIGLAEYLFGNYFQLDEWVPENVMEYGTNNQHIVVFIEKEDTRLRTFDEAREDVEEFWRRRQAVALAKEAADDVAVKVNNVGTGLGEQFPTDAKPVGEFSWNTTGQLYPVLDGEVQTGPEFMETAFELELNKAGVAANATNEQVYVIQVTAIDNRSEKELQDLFFTELAANSTRGGMSDGMNRLYEVDTQEFISKMFEDINKEFDVKWLAH